MSKKSVLSWQIIEFSNNLLEFFWKICLSFFGLEFFSKCPKKACINKAKKTKNFSQGWVKVENPGLNSSQGLKQVKNQGWDML